MLVSVGVNSTPQGRGRTAWNGHGSTRVVTVFPICLDYGLFDRAAVTSRCDSLHYVSSTDRLRSETFAIDRFRKTRPIDRATTGD